MGPSSATVVMSRSLVSLLGLIVWMLFYQDARLAYRLRRGLKRLVLQLSCVIGSVGIFTLQVQLMEHLAPTDARGDFFRAFVFAEAGGALAVLFATLLRERSKSKRTASGA